MRREPGKVDVEAYFGLVRLAKSPPEPAHALFRLESLGDGLADSRLRDIVGFIVMPTSVHLPEELLKAVDRKAKSLRMSRNQFVVRALQREVGASEWSAGFFERLAPDADANKAVDEMLVAIRKGRRSKPVRQF